MKRVIIATLLVLFFCAGVFAQADLQVLAVVKLKGSEPITLGTLKSRVSMFEKQRGGAKLSVAEKKEVLDSIIDEKLVLQAADKAGIAITDAQVDQAFQNYLSNMAGAPITEAQFNELMQKQYNMTLESYLSTQTGMSLAEYKKQLKQQLVAQNYIVSQKRNELQSLSQVSHDEITRFYNNNQTKFVQPEIATLFMVLVPKGSDEAAAKKSADDLLASVKSGKLKKDAMIENSKKGETKYQAGYVYAARGEGIAQQLNMTQKEFDDLFNSKLDTFSAVQEQADHYRFYAVTKKDATKFLTLNDIVQPNTTITVYKYIENQLALQKQNEALLQVTKDLTTELRAGGNLQMSKTGDALDKLLNW